MMYSIVHRDIKDVFDLDDEGRSNCTSKDLCLDDLLNNRHALLCLDDLLNNGYDSDALVEVVVVEEEVNEDTSILTYYYLVLVI